MDAKAVNTMYSLGRQRSIMLLMLCVLATLAIFDIGIISLSFIFWGTLIMKSLKGYKFFFIPRGNSQLLVLIVIVALISLVVSEVLAIDTTSIRALQLVYWLLLALLTTNPHVIFKKSLHTLLRL